MVVNKKNMINFDWKFKMKEVIPYDIDSGNVNVLKSLEWNLIGKDSEYPNKTNFISGCISFSLENLDNFIVLENISRNELQSWVESRVGIEKINEFKNMLEDSINKLPNDYSSLAV
jgi:hypothetical protein